MSTDTHSAAIPVSSGIRQPYHLVDPSPWPIISAFSGGLLLFGIAEYANHHSKLVLPAGIAAVLLCMFGWWRQVLKESNTPGLHSPLTRLGLRYAMLMFIASEVMFFAAFFWAYFNFSIFPSNMGNLTSAAAAVWPPAGVHTFNPLHLPLVNTLILLTSALTLTWAHHGIAHGNRRTLIIGLILTIVLGMSFTICQAREYSEAPFKFTDGIYQSVFYMATGFHGFHVIVGTIFLTVCLIRALRGGFTAERHFGFEAAAWYWHFVDVVWLFLFVAIYWLGYRG
ncbi:cytochrome c oxidase subunit 3 [Granulibacter bethesdensis]|uniref:cytochrome c oxidase subunit 3 n=1 Tax=Granulibacter bethesdensis TaxID=364410 RepID=UPI0003F1FE55|nr:cytochrome c oxidase subunit 3 [Granulibacter bethesdensis]AHJ65259.1 Cytochrome c oxidase polypeptide III [Granulibacter bethesdensis CGDNIH4]